MGISGHLEKPKPFSNDCLVNKNQIDSKCCNFLSFLKEIKDKVFTIRRFH